MVGVPVGGDTRQMAVASPGYLKAHGRPEHPRDLLRFRCIGWRPSPDAAPYRWEFVEDGQPLRVQVNPRITTNDPRFILRSALTGSGVAFATEETFRRHVERGELISLLDKYLEPFPGFFLYFPARRHMPRKLRPFVDHVRAGFPASHADC